VEIRPADRADAEAVAAIYAHYVTTSTASFAETPSSAAEVGEKIASSTLPFLVAEEEGRVQGYAYLAPYNERGAYRHTAECSVYVADAARGRGIGRALLERLLAEAPGADVREVIAIIGVTDGEASIALHRAFGFREAGLLTDVGHKFGRWHDTVLMQRSLRP
jgi:phosphinothricin acetyltransferase